MSYYEALGFTREPFSNSPDPDLLYRSRIHLECLQQMEIAVRLRRGLNVVLGEVGTGKTTLARELVRLLATDEDIEVFLLDDPYYPTPAEFMLALLRLFGRDGRNLGRDTGLLRDALKETLLDLSGDGRRIVALFVDEGQKLTGDSLELLRELLNFEANTHKLLQIVIFGQTELETELAKRPNLEDRVNFRYVLTPLDRVGTRRMIETRMGLCMPDGQTPALFTPLAMRRIHRYSRGYPRKIVRLCHMSMLLAIGLGKKRVGWRLVGRAARESLSTTRVWLPRLAAATAIGGMAAFGLTLATVQFQPREQALRAWSAVLSRMDDSARFVGDSVAAATDAGKALVEGGDGKVSVTVSMTVAAHGQAAPGPAVATADEPVSRSAPVAPAAVLATPSVPAPAVAKAPVTAVRQMPDEPVAAAPVAGKTFVPAMSPSVPALEEHTLADSGAVRDVPPAVAAPASPDTVATGPQNPMRPASRATPVADDAPIVISVGATVPETGPRVAPLAVVPVSRMPGELGTLSVRPGGSVLRMAARIYGHGDWRVLDALRQANPGLDLDRVVVGASLVFPTIEAAPLPEGVCLLRVAEVQSLKEGYTMVERYRRSGPALSLFVTYNPATGLQFDVVTASPFADQATAMAFAAGLPRQLAAKAGVITAYSRDTVFFTELGEPQSQHMAGTPAPERKPVPFAGRQVAQRGPLGQPLR